MPWQAVAVGKDGFIRCPLYTCLPYDDQNPNNVFHIASTQLVGSYRSLEFWHNQMGTLDEQSRVQMTTKQPVHQAWSAATKMAARTTAPDLTTWALKDTDNNPVLVPWNNNYHAVDQSAETGMGESHDQEAFVAEMQRYLRASQARSHENEFSVANDVQLDHFFTEADADCDTAQYPHLTQAKEYMSAMTCFFGQLGVRLSP